MNEVEKLKVRLEKCENTVAELTDRNQLLESQVDALEGDIEDLSAQLEDCENGTDNAGFIDPISDDNENDDISLDALGIKQQAELDSLLNEFREVVDEKDAIIATLEETAKHRDSLIESQDDIIKLLKDGLKHREELVERYREDIESNQGVMSEIFRTMQARIDKRNVLLLIHRDKLTAAEAVEEFAKANDRPLAEVQKLMENSDL